MTTPVLEVLLPIHNEAESIEATLREIYGAVARVVSVRFLLCEDGSTDGTPEVLARLARELPIRLFSGQERKGYSRAVIDGFRRVDAPWVFFLDSDGQIDPSVFASAWPKREAYDVIIGWRVQRADALYRRLMSRAFRAVYLSLIHI